MLYEDNCVAIDDEGITIFNYYFPLGQPKKIAWSQIKSIWSEPLTAMTGKYRYWGMGLRPYWLHNDWRVNKDQMLIIDTGRWIKPAITPDNCALAKFAIEKKIAVK